MAYVSLSNLQPALVKTVVAARNGHGAHSYYADGWWLSWGDTKVELPGRFEENGSFTVVFQHIGTSSKTKFFLLLGEYDAEDKTHVAIQADKEFTCIVKENKEVKTAKSEKINHIPMNGLHVWRFERRTTGLEVSLDGQRCVKAGTIKDNLNAYSIMKGYPLIDSPFIIWETHQILPNITLQFDPRYWYVHQKMKFGLGSYAEFYGKWDKEPRIGGGPLEYTDEDLENYLRNQGLISAYRVIYLNKEDVSNKAGMKNPIGEQILTVKVLVSKYMMVSSAKSTSLYFYGDVPVDGFFEVTRPANPLYNLTYVFVEMR